MTTTGTTTMYAEDTTAFQYEVGPNSKFPAGSEDAGNAMNYIEFDALSSFTLNEITVWAKVYSPNESYTIGVQLRDNAGNLVGTPVVRTVTGPPIVPANRDWPFTITLGMGVPAGNGYRLTNEGTVGNILFWARGANPAGSVDWASYRVNGVIALKGLDAGYNYCNGTCYGFAYNWKISKGNNCARVPVTVVEECPLPLAWLDFTVEKLNESALLNWSTVDEKNTSHFVIERSTNGKNYKAIGQKNAYGQIYNNHYHFEDKTPAKGTVYYRIAQYDRDGAYTYSSIRTIENKNTEIIAYPTKHNGQFSLHVSALPMEESVIDVYLFNTTGTEVYKQRHQVVGGLLNTEINISDFANGIYLIKVSTNDGIYTAKCIKE